MVVHAGFVVQLVLLLLFLFSVVSWAIILMKYVNIRKIRKENSAFLSVYMKSTKLSEIFPEAKKVPEFDAGGGFPGGYTELVKITRVLREPPTVKDAVEAAGPVLEIGGSTMWSGR